MTFQTEIKPLIESAIQSIGTILELSAAFATMQSDSIFKEVLALSNDLSDLDMRAQFNYSCCFSPQVRYVNVIISFSC